MRVTEEGRMGTRKWERVQRPETLTDVKMLLKMWLP